MHTITPFLWFDSNAEEAVRFYTSIFKDSKIDSITRYTEVGPGPAGSVLTITFHLDGQELVALNGGPMYTFSPAVSFSVNCETQEEIDELWEKLSEGGKQLNCGWLTDRYGLSWQIVPAELGGLIHSSDSERNERVMRALLKMHKLDLEVLRRAYTAK